MTEQNAAKKFADKIKAAPNWVKTSVLLAALGGTAAVYTNRDDIVGPPAVQSQTELAAVKAGDRVEMVVTINGGKEFGTSFTLLNTHANYQDPANVTFRCPGGTRVSDFKGKKVKVVGTRSEYNGKAQIAVDSIKLAD